MELTADTTAPARRPTAYSRDWVWAVLGGSVGTAAALVGVGAAPAVGVGLLLGMLGGMAAVADLRYRRIPDPLVLIGAAGTVAAAMFLEITGERRPALDMLVGAAVAAGPLLIVHLVAPAGVGFGDVKLAAVVGALLGAISPSLSAAALVAACVLALAGVVTGRWHRSSIPFGACLAAAALGCLAVGRWWAA